MVFAGSHGLVIVPNEKHVLDFGVFTASRLSRRGVFDLFLNIKFIFFRSFSGL